MMNVTASTQKATSDGLPVRVAVGPDGSLDAPLADELTLDEIRRQVATIAWYHQIDLGNGIMTPGHDRTFAKLRRLKIPQSMAGKTVLDIGSWDGFFCFEAERRGAQRVRATDRWAWSDKGRGLDKRGFDLAKRVLRSQVEEQLIDVLDITPEKVDGQWDIVFFMGVLYHMKHPLLSLERVASVTREMAIIETVVDIFGTRRPVMAFYPGNEMALDYSNWCGPNVACVIAMLKTVGFKRCELVAGPRGLLFRIARAIRAKKNRNHNFWWTMRSDRIVIHAYK